LQRLVAAHREQRPAATLLSVVLDEPGAYGRVLREADGGVRAIVEARDATDEVRAVREINAGIYVFEVPALLRVLGELRPQNARGGSSVPAGRARLRAKGERVAGIAAEDPAEALGVNSLAELAAASRLLRARRTQALMAAGVGIEDPESTHVGLDAVVEADAILRP